MIVVDVSNHLNQVIDSTKYQTFSQAFKHAEKIMKYTNADYKVTIRNHEKDNTDTRNDTLLKLCDESRDGINTTS